MTAVLPLHGRGPDNTHDPLAIRRAVTATKRLCPTADTEGFAEYAIKVAAPTRVIKAILFDMIAAAVASRPGEIAFTRASFGTIASAARRRA